VVHRAERPEECDLLSGCAGAIVALLALNTISHSDHLLDFAILLGEKLRSSAQEKDLTYSWTSSDHPTRQNLTGLSHGAAGIGCALVELSVRTRDVEYLAAAERAFAYERSCFDANEENWIDFREDKPATKGPWSTSFAVSWCHGAPGIALSRLRAYELTRAAALRADALIALRTTRRSVSAAVEQEASNYSLCHGLLGNAEILLCGSSVSREDTDRDLPRKVGLLGLRRHHE